MFQSDDCKEVRSPVALWTGRGWDVYDEVPCSKRVQQIEHCSTADSKPVSLDLFSLNDPDEADGPTDR